MTTPIFPRRHFLRSATAGSLLFPGIVRQLLAEAGDAANPLAPRAPHFPAKAKNVIFLFMTGGVSHIDTFDPKPVLAKSHGKEIAPDHPAAKGRDDYKRIYLKRPDWEFQPYGQSGTEVSSLFPHVGGCVDDIALIRSIVERGVRFVELIDVGSSQNWDAHGNMKTHEPLAKNVDQPIAALIRDLKQRGMFEDTLVVWTTEFGRTPFNKSADHKGREHHPTGFSSWLAGAGVKRGIVHGAADEIGMNAVEKPVHVRDFHATILHLMGLDHERLTYHHSGLDFKLTGVEHARVVKELLS